MLIARFVMPIPVLALSAHFQKGSGPEQVVGQGEEEEAEKELPDTKTKHFDVGSDIPKK